jgi:hypothetical protein
MADQDVTRAPATTGGPSRPPVVRLLAQRSVQVTIAAWVLANVLVVVLARGHLPFHRPSVQDQPVARQLVFANLALVPVFLLIAVTYWLTRRRAIPDLAARAPEHAKARREVALVVGYGVVALAVGFVLGKALGWHPFSFHLVGTLYGTDDGVSRAEVFVWAAYNFVAYAVVPYLYFRRRYTAEQLSLRSSDRRNDILVIVVVLAIESLFELTGFTTAIFHLGPRQLLLGAPLTFAVYFVGTVLPTMVFIYCILVPRYLKLTGSVATTVILGGVTYTLMHCFDAWLNAGTVSAAVLSVVFLFLQYFGPGMIKTVLTLRTGNAWVHVWAYHAVAPHVYADTPLIAKIFKI